MLGNHYFYEAPSTGETELVPLHTSNNPDLAPGQFDRFKSLVIITQIGNGTSAPQVHNVDGDGTFPAPAGTTITGASGQTAFLSADEFVNVDFTAGGADSNVFVDVFDIPN